MRWGDGAGVAGAGVRACTEGQSRRYGFRFWEGSFRQVRLTRAAQSSDPFQASLASEPDSNQKESKSIIQWSASFVVGRVF